MAVRCTVAGREPAEALLVEASLSGCRIEIEGHLLEPGDRITLSPPAMHGLISVVRWVSAKTVGLQFAKPLPQVVLMHLLYEPAERQEWDFTDGFGRRVPTLRSPD